MHGNSELMGVLPERDWILRAPTLQRKLALTAKIQDEVGRCAADLPRRRGPGQAAERLPRRPRRRQGEVPQRLPLPDEDLGRRGVIAWLVDAAAIISQKALLKCSYAPYARIMKKICWEENFHILHGRDVILAMVTGTRAAGARAGGARPLVGAAHALPRQPDPGRGGPDGSSGGSRARANEEARQQFLEGYVPQIRELGLEIPDPKLRRGDEPASGRTPSRTGSG